jgi:hypothetical protein
VSDRGCLFAICHGSYYAQSRKGARGMDERDRHEGERRKLYENEAFAITVFQAVSAASAFGIISSSGC